MLTFRRRIYLLLVNLMPQPQYRKRHCSLYVAVLALCVFIYNTSAGYPQSNAIPAYDRNYFGLWLDNDSDCQNTRHELLIALSLAEVTFSPNGCRVIFGKWLDSYTGSLIETASEIDVDHLVPLKWAWIHGAWKWSDQDRINFANDTRNLFLISDSVNRSKGAKGPTDWLPPSMSFRCEYFVRFMQLVALYKLELHPTEYVTHIDFQREVCE